MNISNKQRALKLGFNFARRPDFIGRYCLHLPLWGRSPIEFALPWWSYSAIEYVKEWCTTETNVFEYGSGGSTIFFAQRCKHVLAIEDDSNWRDFVSDRLAISGIKNAKIQFHPFDFKTPKNFEDSSYLQSLNHPAYDIIVIDGQDWTFKERLVCFRRAENYIRPGGIIIMDDSWRYTDLRNSNRAKSYKIFESVGPCRYGVTSTDIYFY